MKIFIVGATRGIGLQLVVQALRLNHKVTVLARDPSKMSIRHEQLTLIKGDILDLDSVSLAMSGQEAALCTIGIKPTFKPVRVFSEGTKNLLSAMKRFGVRRLICVTGIGAGDSKGHGGFLYDRIFRPFILKTIYQDKDRQEALIMASDVDWIIVRPAFLTNGPLTGKYRVLTDLTDTKVQRISRVDVAHFMLEQLESDRYLKKTPLITY